MWLKMKQTTVKSILTREKWMHQCFSSSNTEIGSNRQTTLHQVIELWIWCTDKFLYITRTKMNPLSVISDSSHDPARYDATHSQWSVHSNQNILAASMIDCLSSLQESFQQSSQLTHNEEDHHATEWLHTHNPTVWKRRSPVNNSIAIQATPQISDSSSHSIPINTSGARYWRVLIVPFLRSVE